MKLNLTETEKQCVDWIYLAHDRNYWWDNANGQWTFGFHKRQISCNFKQEPASFITVKHLQLSLHI